MSYDPCRWCEEPSITDHNPEGILWIARDWQESGWVACTFHLGKAVNNAWMNNPDEDLPVKVEVYMTLPR